MQEDKEYFKMWIGKVVRLMRTLDQAEECHNSQNGTGDGDNRGCACLGSRVAAIRGAVTLLPIHPIGIQTPVAHVSHAGLSDRRAAADNSSPAAVPCKPQHGIKHDISFNKYLK